MWPEAEGKYVFRSSSALLNFLLWLRADMKGMSFPRKGSSGSQGSFRSAKAHSCARQSESCLSTCMEFELNFASCSTLLDSDVHLHKGPGTFGEESLSPPPLSLPRYGLSATRLRKPQTWQPLRFLRHEYTVEAFVKLMLFCEPQQPTGSLRWRLLYDKNKRVARPGRLGAAPEWTCNWRLRREGSIRWSLRQLPFNIGQQTSSTWEEKSGNCAVNQFSLVCFQSLKSCFSD